MSRTIQCAECGVSLNLPEHALGRRLKCPKCGRKFFAEGGGAKGNTTSQPPAGSGPESTFELSGKASVGDLPVMPTATGDLRETFGLPLMTDSSSSAKPAKSTADALTLFNEPEPTPRRKKGAEGRATARRCPTCGGVVPIGMSICQTCGLDLDTGLRVGLEDDLAPSPLSTRDAFPMTVALIGGISTALSVGGIIFSAMNWDPGGPYFAVVALFGVFAAVQFLRRKSVKPLLVALTIGALINVAALIAMPIYNANNDLAIVQRKGTIDDPNLEHEVIQSGELDVSKLQVGIGVLFLYAVVSIYLLSPQIQKHFKK